MQPNKDWREKFDEEFHFTGIEHQLEGDALRQDLIAFISSLLNEVIEGIPDSRGNKHETMLNGTMLKKQLKIKWGLEE